MENLQQKLKELQQDNDEHQFDTGKCLMCMGNDRTCEAYFKMPNKNKCYWAEIMDNNIQKYKRKFGFA